jgi:hypothetical protein
VFYRGQKEALVHFLPLDKQNWITCGNALRLDWLSICPPTGTGVKLYSDDLFNTPLEQAQIDFENEGGETYICGNPPYVGSTWQSDEQKSDLKEIFESPHKNLEIARLCGWLVHESRRLWNKIQRCSCFRINQLYLPRAASTNSMAAYL